MNIFDPLTVGYGWRINIRKPNLEDPDRKTVTELAYQLNRKYGKSQSRPNRGAIGHSPASIRHFDELLERTLDPFAEIRRYCDAHDLILLPSGVWDANLYFNVGPLFNPEAAILVRNALIRYEPILIALLANSPFDGGTTHLGEYKCYRHIWNWNLPPIPMEVNGYQPDFSDMRVGHDSLSLGSTDTPTSPRLVCEYVAFASCFTAALADDVGANGASPITPDSYTEYIYNRWLAAKYALQANFRWKGDEIPIVTLLKDMLAFAEPKLREFGVSGDDLTLIHQMIEKRQTQADWIGTLLEHHADAHVLYQAFVNFAGAPNAFEAYLKLAPELPNVEQMSLGDEIAKQAKWDSRYWDVHHRTKLPQIAFDRLLTQLEAAGKLQLEKHRSNGLLLSNTGVKTGSLSNREYRT